MFMLSEDLWFLGFSNSFVVVFWFEFWDHTLNGFPQHWLVLKSKSKIFKIQKFKSNSQIKNGFQIIKPFDFKSSASLMLMSTNPQISADLSPQADQFVVHTRTRNTDEIAAMLSRDPRWPRPPKHFQWLLLMYIYPSRHTPWIKKTPWLRQTYSLILIIFCRNIPEIFWLEVHGVFSSHLTYTSHVTCVSIHYRTRETQKMSILTNFLSFCFCGPSTILIHL